jgi:SAM-dependent methyltransferase
LVERHYETFSEGPRLQKSRVRRLEFETTLAVLDKHLAPGASILELGAGHGAYAFHFARRGHRVLATDLVEANVAAMAAQQVGGVEVRRADAIDLSGIGDRSFGAVLCLGPYYHLRTRALRARCLSECRRVVADDGFVAVSHINRAFAIGYLLKMGKSLTPEQYASLVDPDDQRADYPDEFFNVTHFSTAESVAAEARATGLELVEHAGTDGILGFSPELLEALDEKAFDAYRAHHLANTSEPSFHCLSIFRRS